MFTWLTTLFCSKEIVVVRPKRKTYKKLSRKEKEEVVQQALKGTSKRDIASYFDVSIANVYKVLRDAKR